MQDTIRGYMDNFPSVFDYLARSSSNASKDVFHVDDVFGAEDGPELSAEALEKLAQLAKWIKELPSSNSPRQPCGTQTLDEDVVRALEECVDSDAAAVAAGARRKVVTMQVRPHLLYKPDLHQGSAMPDEAARFFLFDRVVNVREGHSVPLGLRGTITGEYSLLC